MIANMYVIHDRLVGDSCPIFEGRNHAAALRMSQSVLAKLNKDEFKLLYLGTFDHSLNKADFLDVPEDIPFDFGSLKVVEDEPV